METKFWAWWLAGAVVLADTWFLSNLANSFEPLKVALNRSKNITHQILFAFNCYSPTPLRRRKPKLWYAHLAWTTITTRKEVLQSRMVAHFAQKDQSYWYVARYTNQFLSKNHINFYNIHCKANSTHFLSKLAKVCPVGRHEWIEFLYSKVFIETIQSEDLRSSGWLLSFLWDFSVNQMSCSSVWGAESSHYPSSLLRILPSVEALPP